MEHDGFDGKPKLSSGFIPCMENDRADAGQNNRT